MKNLKTSANDLASSVFEGAVHQEEQRHSELLSSSGGENPYLLHQQLGDIMTRAATVVRENKQLDEAIAAVDELHRQAKSCSVTDSGSWTNQNVIFTKALQDMFPIAKCILKGARLRDECRGAHYKPEFEMPSLSDDDDPATRRREAEAWCDAFEEKNSKFLKSSVASCHGDDVEIAYEDVDTSSIPPRPRLYGIVGGEVIEQVWRERTAQKTEPEAAKV